MLKVSVFVMAFAALLYLPGCGGFVTCVAEGTLIATPDGDRAIETLRPGDPVLSLEPEGGMAPGTVVSVHRGTADHLLEVVFDDGTLLRLTPDHLLRVGDRWLRAKEVRAGDPVARPDRSAGGTIRSVTPVNQRTRVFDLTIDPHSNYVANGVLVHNKTIWVLPEKEMFIGDAWIARDSVGYVYRLVFHPDGSGTAARTYGFYPGIEIEPLEFEFWKLDRYEIEVQLYTTVVSRQSIYLRGPAWRRGFVVQFVRSGIQSDEKTTFYREGQVLEEWGALRDSMENGPSRVAEPIEDG